MANTVLHNIARALESINEQLSELIESEETTSHWEALHAARCGVRAASWSINVAAMLPSTKRPRK